MAKTVSKQSVLEKQKKDIIYKIVEYKLGAEASIVSMIYRNPDLLRENNLVLNEFSHNCWKVFFEIAYGMVIDEGMMVLSETAVGLYLGKHPKLSERYDEYGGYETIVNASYYTDEKNFDGFVRDLKKWNAVIKMVKRGFPCDEQTLSEMCDFSAEEIYDMYNIHLNDIFSNIENEIVSYNGFSNMVELIDELDAHKNTGIPFTGCKLLSDEIDGMTPGSLIGFGASSGVGKSTLSINYIFPSIVEQDLKALFIINEEDEKKFRKEALIWYCNNKQKEDNPKYRNAKDIQKKTLRDGGFDQFTKERLYDAAKWFESQQEKRHITIIPLERYTAKTVVKLIRKYTKMDVNVIVLDTLKESADSRDKESWKSMMNDCVDFYDSIKHTKTCMIITYQLVKNKNKYLTSADIGVSKGILDVFSVNIFFRRPLQTEYDGEKDALYCYKMIEKTNAKQEYTIKKEDREHYMIAFINKNRFGRSDIQILSKADFSVNKYEDDGYCVVLQDY